MDGSMAVETLEKDFFFMNLETITNAWPSSGIPNSLEDAFSASWQKGDSHLTDRVECFISCIVNQYYMEEEKYHLERNP